jgi:hypothetical protein
MLMIYYGYAWGQVIDPSCKTGLFDILAKQSIPTLCENIVFCSSHEVTPTWLLQIAWYTRNFYSDFVRVHYGHYWCVVLVGCTPFGRFLGLRTKRTKTFQRGKETGHWWLGATFFLRVHLTFRIKIEDSLLEY